MMMCFSLLGMRALGTEIAHMTREANLRYDVLFGLGLRIHCKVSRSGYNRHYETLFL